MKISIFNFTIPRGINFRTADEPWGLWSEPQVLFDPWLDDGYCNFMPVSRQFQQCDSIQDAGRQNEWGGEYGPYQFKNLATGTDSSTTIYFTLSTWNPYTVVLMKSTLFKQGFPASVAEKNPQLPDQIQLWQNYPNRFNPATTIRFSMPLQQHVTLQVFDLQGRVVATLVDNGLAQGEFSMTFKWHRASKRRLCLSFADRPSG